MFPRACVQLRCSRTEPAPGRVWRRRLTWAFDFALTTAIVVLCLEYHPLQFAVHTFAQHERRFHAQLAQLDAGLHKLVLNTDGMGYLFAEAN